jgi:hypothetical protein
VTTLPVIVLLLLLTSVLPVPVLIKLLMVLNGLIGVMIVRSARTLAGPDVGRRSGGVGLPSIGFRRSWPWLIIIGVSFIIAMRGLHRCRRSPRHRPDLRRVPAAVLRGDRKPSPHVRQQRGASRCGAVSTSNAAG